jgi:hypothetical protein
MNTAPHLTVSIECLRLPLVPFIMCGRSIVGALTENEYYADIVPDLAVVSDAIELLASKVGPAANRDRLALVARDMAWREAGLLLRQLAGSVQARCQNNLLILLSSGFVPTRRRSPIGPLPAPKNLRLRFNQLTGESKILFEPVKGARGGYLVQIAEDMAGPFTDYGTSTSSRALIKGLAPLKYYFVRVRAHGAAGPGSWSGLCRLLPT